MTGPLNVRADIRADRLNGTGLVFFSNLATNYIFFDGGKFSFTNNVQAPDFASTGAVSGVNMYASGSYIASGNCEPWGNILFQSTYGANRWTSDGNFVVGARGYQPGGGAWSDSSDARIKTVESEYTNGLESVCALRPIIYRFKGNDTIVPPDNLPLPPAFDENGSHVEQEDTRAAPSVPYPNSQHYPAAMDNRSFIGLVAQEVDPALPEMITKRPGFINGVLVNDVHDLDTSPLIYALVNSVKELKAMNDQLAARIAQLEAQ
jgi:hypothetical protein